MIFCSLLWICILTVWILLAGGRLSPSPLIVLSLQFFMGLGVAVFNMSNVRLTMVVTPEMGRHHFFALYSVVANMSLGLAPVIWGIIIDLFHDLNVTMYGLQWNRFTVYFLGAAILFLVTILLKFRLEEPSSKNVEDLVKEMFISSPLRMIARVWPR
jgi:MFS family permease